mgnify:CR=1 FL=1
MGRIYTNRLSVILTHETWSFCHAVIEDDVEDDNVQDTAGAVAQPTLLPMTTRSPIAILLAIMTMIAQPRAD